MHVENFATTRTRLEVVYSNNYELIRWLMAKQVTIYSTPTCHFCHMAKDYFTQKGVAFTDYNVATDLEKRQEMMQKSGQMGVPVIMIDNDLIVGFDQPRIAQLLGV